MTISSINNSLGMMAASPAASNRPSSSSDGGDGNWFEALSQAWGRTLDSEAGKISEMSNAMGGNGSQENPSDITKLTAESMRMSFLSNSSSSSIDSVGKSLETMARKN